MTDPENTPDELRAKIADIDGQLRTLRGETEGVAEQVGGQGDGAQDSEDVAAALPNAEEPGALIAALEGRRESLQTRLDSAE